MTNTASTPKISIVTVSFNHAQFIRQNIESVLQQNYPNFEHLIIDAVSTDGTLDILRSYPHLKWTSEPDRGQSDALNKGFSRATGDIIGWLNSDDWYAPNIFSEIAEALAEHPIVIGAGQETDKQGNPRQIVPNIERNFFDILKYWVPYAWLAQPPIFFRKSLLEDVRRPDGTYIDENLFFTMDFDLWARMSARVAFNKRIKKVLAYYRIYDENKTGKYPIATQRECSRVFRRYSYSLSNTESAFSIIIPLSSIAPEISDTLKSIAAQKLRDLEIVFVDYSQDRGNNKQIREIALELSNVFDHNNIRLIKSEASDLYTALNSGIKAACAPLIIVLQEGDIINPDFLLQARELFLPDAQGLALPLAWSPELRKLLYNPLQQGLELKIDSLLKMPYIFPNIVARKVCLLEIGAFQHQALPPLSLRELIIRVAHKSWAVSVNSELSIVPIKKKYAVEEELLKVFEPYINAFLMQELSWELENDPFARVRLENNITFAIPEAARAKANQVLQTAPKDWHCLSFLENKEILKNTCESYPNFACAWYFLAQEFEGRKEIQEAQDARDKYKSLLAAVSGWY